MSDIALLGMPTADQVFGRRLTPAACQSEALVLPLVIKVLPSMEGQLAKDLVEHFALALVDWGYKLRAVRSVLSSVLAHRQQAEIVRLQGRLTDLLAPRRRESTAVA